jgi:hypothetical protein
MSKIVQLFDGKEMSVVVRVYLDYHQIIRHDLEGLIIVGKVATKLRSA